MAALAPLFPVQLFDDAGSPVAGGKLYTYQSGTTTNKTTFVNPAGTVTNTNPIILDAAGRCDLWLGNGKYTFRLTTSGDALIRTWDSTGGVASADDIQPAIDASIDAAMARFGVYAEDFPGYDKTGALDSTVAIQNAISAAGSAKTYTVFITGTPKIMGPLTYTTMLALVGVEGGDVFSNDADNYPNRIKCGAVNGYIFDMPDVDDGSGSLSLTNLCFDGRTSGATRSTTLQGIVKSSATSGKSSFYLRLHNVIVGGSASATSMLELSGQVFAHASNCMFRDWPYGYGSTAGGAGLITTTITFEKCYWNSVRQVGEYAANATDAHYRNCVMESCLSGVASTLANVTFDGGYSENMGYDASGTGLTTGLSDRALGFVDAPIIAGKVSAIFTCRYGQMIFRDYTILNTTGGKKWFDGIGRANGSSAGGVMVIDNLSLAAGTVNTLFAADADTPSSRGAFEYHLTVKRGSPTVVTAADARMVTLGRVPIQFNDGTTRPVDVNNGLFSVPALAVLGFTAVPTIYPDGGAWAVGDEAHKAAPNIAAGTESEWVCTTAGTTAAAWDTLGFTALSKSGTVLAAGTLDVPVVLIEVGTVYVYEITGTNAAATALQYSATVRIAHLTSGSTASITESLDLGTTTISYSHTLPITITNSNAFSMTYYARLISVGRTHA